jgi:hypothetical protein
LNKHCGDLWVETNRKQHGGKFNCVFTKHARLVSNGEGMQVDNAVEHVVGMLTRNPIAESAEVVAQMNVAGWLNARKYASHGATLVQAAQRAQDISAP